VGCIGCVGLRGASGEVGKRPGLLQRLGLR
jgi:hypothetical protein